MANRDQHLRGIRAKLEVKLSGLNQNLIQQADATDLSGAAAAAIVEALGQIPGARAVAADMVSGAMFKGLGATFDEYSDQVDTPVGQEGGGWDYTAVMDGATCDECSTWDGTHFATWEEIAGPGGPLPDGGPHEDCFGGDRCRCRAAVA